MGIFERFFGKSTEKRSAVSISDPAIARVFGIASSAESALLTSVASHCVSLVASAYASSDVTLFSTKSGSPVAAESHPLYDIMLNGTDDQSAHSIKFALMSDLLSHGEAFAFCEFDNNGKIVNMTPKSWNNMTVEIGNGRYRYLWSDPLRSFNQIVYRQDDILHVRWREFNGRGRSPLSLARLSMTTAANTERAVEVESSRGFRASGILSSESAISDETASRLKSHFETAYAGPEATGRVAVVGDGLKFQQLQFSNADNEISEARRFNATMIAIAFGVPVQLVLPFFSTWNSVGEANRSLVNHCLEPWSQVLNQAITAFCLSRRERRNMYLASDWAALLSGSLKDKAAAYSSMLTSGLISPNEARQVFDLPAVPNGDQIRVPLNTASLQAESDPDATAIGGAA